MVIMEDGIKDMEEEAIIKVITEVITEDTTEAITVGPGKVAFNH